MNKKALLVAAGAAAGAWAVVWWQGQKLEQTKMDNNADFFTGGAASGAAVGAIVAAMAFK